MGRRGAIVIQSGDGQDVLSDGGRDLRHMGRIGGKEGAAVAGLVDNKEGIEQAGEAGGRGSESQVSTGFVRLDGDMFNAEVVLDLFQVLVADAELFSEVRGTGGAGLGVARAELVEHLLIDFQRDIDMQGLVIGERAKDRGLKGLWWEAEIEGSHRDLGRGGSGGRRVVSEQVAAGESDQGQE